MTMTAEAKNELGSVESTTACCRQAEVVTLLRFAGELQAMTGRVVVTAELDTGAVARRLRATIHELYGHPADVRVLTTDRRTSTRYLLRVLTKGWAELVRVADPPSVQGCRSRPTQATAGPGRPHGPLNRDPRHQLRHPRRSGTWTVSRPMTHGWIVVVVTLASALAFSVSSSVKQVSAGQVPDAQVSVRGRWAASSAPPWRTHCGWAGSEPTWSG